MSERGFTEQFAMPREARPSVPELNGRLEVGVEARKRHAATAKVHDEARSLYAVSQGVGSDAGAVVAAREMVRACGAELGEKLDRMVENNASRKAPEADRAAHIDALVRVRMAQAFAPALEAIRLHGVLSKDIAKAGFKAAVAKIVALPGGEKRVYVAHVGDVRAYVARDGKLHALTQDHTPLRTLDAQTARRLDQTIDPDTLPHYERALFAARHEAEVMGDGHEPVPEVQAYTVLPGDRVVIVNAGVHHNLLESELAHLLRFEGDDLEAEALIQHSADDEVGSKHPRGRTVAADMAAVVYTVDKRAGDREYLRPRVSRPQAVERSSTKLHPAITLLDQELARLQAMNAQAVAEHRLPNAQGT